MPVWWGGPVGTNALQIVHRVPDEIPEGMEIAGGLFVGGELEDVAEYTKRHGPEETVRQVRFLLGYAGWGAGQLEEELAQNAWLTAPADNDIIFRTPIEKRADAAAAKLGINLALISPDAGHA